MIETFETTYSDPFTKVKELSLPFWRCTVIFGSTGMIKALSHSLNEVHRRLVIVNKTGNNNHLKTGITGITKMWIFRLALEILHAFFSLCLGFGANATNHPELTVDDLFSENQLCQGLTWNEVMRFTSIFNNLLVENNNINEDMLETQLQEFLLERGNRMHLHGIEVDAIPHGVSPGLIALFENNNDITKGIEQFIHMLRRAEWLVSDNNYIDSVKQIEELIKSIVGVQGTISLIEAEGIKLIDIGKRVLVNYQFKQISQIVNITVQSLRNEYDLEFCRMARALLTSNLRNELKLKSDKFIPNNGTFHWLRTCVDKIWGYLGNAEVSRTGKIRSPRSLRVKEPTR